jgi:hypothetical protein
MRGVTVVARATAIGAVVGAVVVMACQKKADQNGTVSVPARADAPPVASTSHDPCGLVAQPEAEVYLGPLAHAPYRSATDLKGDPDGTACVYRAPGGRNIVVTPNWRDGKMTMKLYSAGQKMAAVVLPDESGAADTLGGEWDDMAWTVPGALVVLKDDVSISVDVSGSKAGIVGAAKLADDAFPRIGKPLAYNGAAAAGDAPGPVVSPRDPCAVFPRTEVEAVLGQLAGDPVSVNNTCVFNLPPHSSYLTRVSVEVIWSGGFTTMSRELWAAHQATGGFTAKIPGGTDGGFLKTDTAGQPPGPWDEAAVIVGGEFAAVRKDVYMSVDLRLFPIDKARRLVAVGMTHL